MKKLLLILLIIISFDISAQTFEWVKTFGGSGDDEGHKCAVDANGNFLFTGSFSEKIDWGENSLECTGSRDMYLIKTDKNGDVLWATNAGGDKNHSAFGKSVATDKNNNVYAGGTFNDTIFFGDQMFVAENEADENMTDIYIAKYNSEGSLQWVKVFAGLGGDVIEEMNIHNNQLVIVGSYKITLDILGNTFTPDDANTQVNYNPIIASLTLDGELNWLNKVNCTSGTCRAFDIDSEGNVNVILEAKGSVIIKNVENSTIYPLKQSNTAQDNYLVKLNGNDGSLVWGNRQGSASFMMGYAVETDQENNVYCGGLFQGELKLESLDGNYEKVTAVNKFDYYVCKYSADGNLLWFDAQGGNSNEGAYDMVVNSNGSIYVAAYFTDPQTNFNGEIFTCEDGNEALLIKYNNEGAFEWIKQTSTTAFSGYIYSMEVTSNDSIVLLGHYKGDGTFFNNETYSNVDDKKNIWFALMADPEDNETTGISDAIKSNSHINIYPVPANQYLFVESNDYADPIENICIYNIIGGIVYRSDTPENKINVCNIPSGVYLVQINSRYNHKTRQIIIQH